MHSSLRIIAYSAAVVRGRHLTSHFLHPTEVRTGCSCGSSIHLTRPVHNDVIVGQGRRPNRR